MPPRDWKDRFVSALSQVPNVSAAAGMSGVSRSHAYASRAEDPEFAARWDSAIEESTDALVGEMYRRAVHGTEKPVFHMGEVCGAVREYSDTLAIFLAKSHRPSVYGDRSKVELSGPDGGPMEFRKAAENVYGPDDADGG
jgi:hypothetical protein